ncbi:hypothetical protein [Saccharopolyspora hattusasensis]|uniref:hypothetical protein n=1 Tax=Saccharopolyspora hattusasensis TaxID=1128679 RepID=UPI003D967903
MTRADEEIDDTIDQDAESSHSADGEAKPKKVTAPQTRRKLTGVELEARFDAWRNEQRAKREARTPEDGARMLRRGLGVIMGAAILALVIASAVTGKVFQADKAENDSRITILEKQVTDAQAMPVDTDLPEKMTKLSEAAAADAGKVRDAQQTYAELYHQSSTQPGTDNGAPNEAMAATAEHRKVLAPLFSKTSYVADDEDAYTWQNVVPFDAASEIDPRFPWYVRYDGWKASDSGTYSWKVETVMPNLGSQDFSGATNEAKAVWLCRDVKSGYVLAWASAVYTYDGQSGVFDDLNVVVTAAGAAHQHPGRKKPDGSDAPEPSGKGTEKKDAKDGQR